MAAVAMMTVAIATVMLL